MITATATFFASSQYFFERRPNNYILQAEDDTSTNTIFITENNNNKVIIKRAYPPLCTVGRRERIRKVFAPLWPPVEEVEIHSPIQDTDYRCQVI